MSQKKFLIYLADLTHDYLDMQQFVPLGIGYLASYARSIFGDRIDIKLFKSADKLLDSVEKTKPGLVGFSNYTWNMELTSFFGRKIKEFLPELPIIMGGPNIGTSFPDIEVFLRQNEFVDVYCMFASEKAVSTIIGELIERPETERTAKVLRSITFDGCNSLSDDKLIGNDKYDSEKNLDFIPSPYTTHLLDEFLDQGMTPLFETNRGCPYSCTFCFWGVSALNKLKTFGLERVCDELDYMAHFGRNFSELFFADANFGILKRDVEISQHLRELYEKTHAFTSVTVFWSKSGQPHMTEIGKNLGHLTTTYVAFQTLDEDVLSAMKRKNISVDRLVGLITSLHDYTHKPQTDILVGSPGETFDSHLRSLDGVLNYGIRLINGGEIRMLPGTEMATKESREKHGIKTKYRLFEGGFGIYRGELVYELEEAIRATNTMTEEDMIRLRILRSMFFGSVTIGEHIPLVDFLVHRGIRFTRVLQKLVERSNDNPDMENVMGWLKKEAEEEFFDTPQDIAAFLAKKENRDAFLGEGAFVKMNFALTARLILNPNEYQAYYDKLEKVLAEEMDDPESSRVVSEILALCRARNYLRRALKGDFENKVALTLSRQTIETLMACGYLPTSTIPEEKECLQLSINEVTARQIRKSIEGFGDQINIFSMSQIMQMFWGRCYMEPKSATVGVGKDFLDHPAIVPETQETQKAVSNAIPAE